MCDCIFTEFHVKTCFELFNGNTDLNHFYCISGLKMKPITIHALNFRKGETTTCIALSTFSGSLTS